jgi:TonB family protein
MNRLGLIPLSLGLALSFQCNVVFSAGECLPEPDRLQYPVAALQRRMQGSLNVQYVVDSNGKASKVEADGHPVFNDAAISALGQELFEPSCMGQQFKMSIQYRLDGDIPQWSPTVAKRLSATAYEVVAPEPVIEVTISDPEWMFNRRKRLFHNLHRFISTLRFW